MKPIYILFSLTVLAFADEREVTPEQLEALQNLELEVEKVERPKNLPDLTKGEPKGKYDYTLSWHLGPTGAVGYFEGGFGGDQIEIVSAYPDSPAAGKLQKGDVITGLNGKKFTTGGHLAEFLGNAIIEAEKEENGGKLVLQVWRDKNHIARTGPQDVTGVDIDKLIDQVDNDNSLYDWKPEVERKQEVTKMNFDKFPIDGSTMDVELKLRVMPAYSETSPYDCPKSKQILEDAWKVLEKRFVVDPKNPRSGMGGHIEAMALIASGKPEHRELVKAWVRSKNSSWGPPTEAIGAQFEPTGGKRGMQTWYYGYVGLNCALYYDATGDDYVLPALRKFAIEAAMGQSGGGSWGHTFAYPSFNGGELNRMNPGYGALNAAGNRCFFLIALAKKHGVEHPAIDTAITRAHRFFGSYVDQGAIPYGDHPAAGTDDSNGKNTGVAFAMRLLGDKYGAKYFAQMSNHSAFVRRGGHGHDYHTRWSGWGASICGPEGIILQERNMRWARTLHRLHDGSFVYQSASKKKLKTLHDPTATEVLYYAQPLKQTLITGKDADESLFSTEREIKQLLASNFKSLTDPSLIKKAGTTWRERSTDELLDMLDIFMPATRHQMSQELGKRFLAGEKEIAPRLVALLDHENPRYRDGALRGIKACGSDAVLSNLSKITKCLEDKHEFVRISATLLIGTSMDQEESQLALLKAASVDPHAVAPNSLRNNAQALLFATDSKLANMPFNSGFDDKLVEQTLESLLLLDPVNNGQGFLATRIKVWDKNTVIRLAGPLTYIAEEEQNNDQMFAGRSAPAKQMLAKFGFNEALEAQVDLLRKHAALPRDIRAGVGFKRALVNPVEIEKNPSLYHEYMDEMKQTLISDPLTSITLIDSSTKWLPYTRPLLQLLRQIEATKPAAKLPSIADDVKKTFGTELAAAKSTNDKLQLCREALADPTRKNIFEKTAAMDFLVEMLEAEAMNELLLYLGSDYWRLRDHSRALAVELVRAGAGSALISQFTGSDPETQVGILAVLAAAKHTPALDLAKQAMKHDLPKVRSQAVQTLGVIGGSASLTEIFTHLKKATHRADVQGCEAVLAAACEDPATAAKIRDALIAQLTDANPIARSTLLYLLAKIADKQSFDTLRKLGQKDDNTLFSQVAEALSYSPSREADKLMIELASLSKPRAVIIGKHAVRRMIIGPKGVGDVLPTQALDFAEAMLKLTLEKNIITYLGQVHEARALTLLMYCLEKGYEGAAESLIANAEGFGKLSAADSKIAAKALQDVIEYIEVTRLRGGVKAHMGIKDNYTGWKSLQARAGKVLLKIHKPETAAIPAFDGLDLDR